MELDQLSDQINDLQEAQLVLDASTADTEALQEAGRVISAANMDVLKKMHTMASGLMSGFPGASKIAEMCQSMIDTGTLDLPQIQEALGDLALIEAERTFSKDIRDEYASKGIAMSDGSFPIPDKGALRRAIMSVGRASDPAAAKRHIIKRARALDATDMLPDDWLKEALTVLGKPDSSSEAMRSKLSKAVQDKFGKQDAPVFVVATYPDHVVYSSHSYDGPSSENLMGVPYTIKNDEITLGEPFAVKTQHIKESMQTRLVEAVSGSEGREWDVLLIESGTSGNGFHYEGSVLKAATPLFAGVSAFADHATDYEMRTRPERSIRDKVGLFSNPEFGSFDVGGKMVEGIRARFKVMVPWLREVLLEAQRAGEPNFLGFSIDARGKTSPRKQDGKVVQWVESIKKVMSVDVVTTAAAGGRTVRLVASQGPEGSKVDMDPEELAKLIRDQINTIVPETVGMAIKEAVGGVTAALQESQQPQQDALAAELTKLTEANAKRDREARVEEKLKTVKLSELGRKRLRESLLDALTRREVSDEEMDASIKESVDYEAAVAGNSRRPLAIRESRITIGNTEADRYDAAIQAMFANEPVKLGDEMISPFHNLREAYCRWTGADPWDNEESGPLAINRAMSIRYDSAVDHKTLRESLNTAQWGSIYADNLYIRMMKVYRAHPLYDRWRKFVSDYEDVPDFQTRHWSRIGGYGDLVVVAEGGTYPTLTTPSNEEVTYAISKRGGLDDVTFEAVVNDRFNAIRRIPDGMGRSAARTLYKFVMNMITTDNPTMDYDSVALYNSAHANTGTTALSLDGVDVTNQAMRKQTAYGESLEILGPRNMLKHVIVPTGLEQRANRIFNPSDTFEVYNTDSAGTAIDPQAFKGKGIDIEVYDQLTDQTDWFAISDPNEVPTIVMGFLNGQQDPEIFVADDPKVGSNLTSDKTVYKVRQIFGGDVEDHRSFYRQVVAG